MRDAASCDWPWPSHRAALRGGDRAADRVINPGIATIEVSYRTPCALWRPEHQCRLTTAADGSHTLQITTWATAWQCTGEDWRDVPLRFSNRAPRQAATAPTLSEDSLRLRRKTEQEKRTVVVEAREQQIAVAGLSRGQRAVDEMPGVDDGGEPLTLTAARPTTLPASGMPVRVEIGTQTLPCQVERIAYPERSIGAHLRATATLTGPRPSLQARTHHPRGELAGRGRIAVCRSGRGLRAGLWHRRWRAGTSQGRRDARDHAGARHPEDHADRAPVLEQPGIPKAVLITERVPVSEIRDVEITVTQPPACATIAKRMASHASTVSWKPEPRAS